jgi:hypothetical protein
MKYEKTIEFRIPAVPTAIVATFLATLWIDRAGYIDALVSRALDVATSPVASLCLVGAAAAGIIAKSKPVHDVEAEGPKPKARHNGKRLAEYLVREKDRDRLAVPTRELASSIAENLRGRIDPARMNWDLAEPMALAMRVFAYTGSSIPMERIGDAVDDHGRLDVGLLHSMVRSIKTAYPFVDLPVPRDGNARVVVMKGHADCVSKAGRPLPLHAFKWLKRFDREMFYGYLNAGREGVGNFHPEGLPSLLEMRADGYADAIRKISEDWARSLLDELNAEAAVS